jgi:hypothetical protein
MIFICINIIKSDKKIEKIYDNTKNNLPSWAIEKEEEY